MPRIAWRLDRSTGRQRPFRPGLGGCLLWFLILVAVLLVLALFFGGFRKGTQTSGLGEPGAGVIAQACRARAASCSPSSSIDFSRISTFRIFPVTVIGNSSTTCTYRGIL